MALSLKFKERLDFLPKKIYKLEDSNYKSIIKYNIDYENILLE